MCLRFLRLSVPQVAMAKGLVGPGCILTAQPVLEGDRRQALAM